MATSNPVEQNNPVEPNNAVEQNNGAAVPAAVPVARKTPHKIYGGKTPRKTPHNIFGGKTSRKRSNPVKNAWDQKRIKISELDSPGKPLKEIRNYQNTTELLIPKASFARVVHEVSNDITQERFNGECFRWSKIALRALQEGAEAHLVYVFEEANLCALHAGRVTLMAKDFKLRELLANK